MNFEEDYVEFNNMDLIHIHKVNTRGRKCESRVIGIPGIFDYKKILKFWKNVPSYRLRTSKPTDVFSRRARRARRRERKGRRKTTKIKTRSSWCRATIVRR